MTMGDHAASKKKNDRKYILLGSQCDWSITRAIQKIRRQRSCRAQKVYKKSNLTHDKIQNNVFYQQMMFQLIWLSSLHYI